MQRFLSSLAACVMLFTAPAVTAQTTETDYPKITSETITFPEYEEPFAFTFHKVSPEQRNSICTDQQVLAMIHKGEVERTQFFTNRQTINNLVTFEQFAEASREVSRGVIAYYPCEDATPAQTQLVGLCIAPPAFDDNRGTLVSEELKACTVVLRETSGDTARLAYHGAKFAEAKISKAPDGFKACIESLEGETTCATFTEASGPRPESCSDASLHTLLKTYANAYNGGVETPAVLTTFMQVKKLMKPQKQRRILAMQCALPQQKGPSVVCAVPTYEREHRAKNPVPRTCTYAMQE